MSKKRRSARKKVLKMDYQEKFLKRMNGLRIGFPDKRGGNTDRGETATRFFTDNPEETSKIIGVPKRLLKLHWKLLVAINQTHSIPNIEVRFAYLCSS